MGSILIQSSSLPVRTSEIIGYKSGLALNNNELKELIPAEYLDLYDTQSDDLLRIRSEEFEEIISNILYKLGRLRSPQPGFSHIHLYHKVKSDPKKLEVYQNTTELLFDFLPAALEENRKTKAPTLDPTPFIQEAHKKWGKQGLEMAYELVMGLNDNLYKSPWTPIREINWKDIKELKEFFESESLDTIYGSFLDQRFIDYLGQNFSKIGEIHWRKFEGLTCEFFDRLGFHVEIGPGRNDEGIDARIWPSKEDSGQAPTILVQCKRQKDKINKMVVKSLYADILEENANSGLIVTSSSVSPGAKTTMKARSYPIQSIERDTLKEWIEVMRTPQKGIFLGE